jgi:hypothetical protein
MRENRKSKLRYLIDALGHSRTGLQLQAPTKVGQTVDYPKFVRAAGTHSSRIYSVFDEFLPRNVGCQFALQTADTIIG